MDVVAAAEVAVGEVVAACAAAVERAVAAEYAVAAVIEEVARLAVDTAALGARLRCRVPPVVHRPLIDLRRVARALGKAMVICRGQEAGRVRAPAIAREAAWLEIVPAALADQVLEIDRAPVRGRAAAHWQAAAAYRRIAICKIFSTFPRVALAAALGHRHVLAVQAQDSVAAARWPEARWLAARLPNSCRTDRAAGSARARAQAAVTWHRLCLRAQVVAAEDDLMLGDLDSQVIAPVISAGPDNPAIVPATSVVLVNRGIVPATSADPVALAIDQVTSADLADRATGPVTLADRVDRVTGPATLVCRAD